MARRKKIQTIDNVRKFVFVHAEGQEVIFAETRPEAVIQAKEIFRRKGLDYKKDKKDVYEIRL